MNDERFMRLALDEAKKALGRTHPNPAVGAVLVKGGRVVATGFHAKAGAPHAEAVTLAKAKARAKGATLYTTLEPCDHFGKTPPCTQAILEAGVREVVFASSDPNPLVNGKGLKRLRAHGVRVVGPVLEEEADALNRPFFGFMRAGRPFVTLKAGVSLDGKLATATGDSKWITSAAAREHAHRLRDRADVIIVGAGTVLSDDPALTTRLPEGGGRTPLRLVLDPSLRTRPGSTVYRPVEKGPGGPARGGIAVAARPSPARLEAFAREGVEVWSLPGKGSTIDLAKVLTRVLEAGYLHVLVEGGAATHSAFLSQGLADEVVLYVAPKLLGHEGLTWSGPLGVGAVAESMTLTELEAEKVNGGVVLRASVVPRG